MVLGALDARVEAVARECNPQEVSNTMWPYATKERKAGEWVLGALDPKGLVLANDFTAHRIVLHAALHQHLRGPFTRAVLSCAR